jgi:hypothetical protein
MTVNQRKTRPSTPPRTVGFQTNRNSSIAKRLASEIHEHFRIAFPNQYTCRDIMTSFLRFPRTFKQWGFAIALIANSIVVLQRNASADIIASADFSTYSDGALVGQKGWVQFLAPSSNPLTVLGGSVSWAGGGSIDNQDAMLVFDTQIGQPTSGTQVYNFDLRLQISQVPVGPNPNVFASIQQSANPDVSIPVIQLWVRSEGAGFVFGTRIDNSSPFAFGTQALNFNETYSLRAGVNMVAGNANDFIELSVGNNFNNLSLQATTIPTGTATDPLLVAMRLAQRGSSTVAEPGVRIFSMNVSSVPEPTSMALMAIVGSLAGVAVHRGRMNAAKQ